MTKTILVTGATDGIGKETAAELVRRGARVLVHGRDRYKAEHARDEIKRATNSDLVEAVAGDLGFKAEIHALAEDVAARGPLAALVNNAGVFLTERRLSEDGIELSFAINHLAVFLLTHLLLPSLEAAKGRVVVVSSIAHNRGELDLDDLAADRGFDGYSAYAGSKLANVLFAFDLARRVARRGVTVNALHPGVIGTKLLRTGFGMGGASVREGAKTSVKLAIDPSLEGVTGRYFADEREVSASRAASDRALQELLYERSAALTGAAPLPLP